MSHHCVHQWMARDEFVVAGVGNPIVVTHLRCIRCEAKRRMTFVKSNGNGATNGSRAVAYEATRAIK